MNTTNYYEVLGVDPTAKENEIKKAYILMIRKFPNETHPEEFKLIRKAYQTLYDREARTKYDKEIQDDGSYQQQLDQINEEIRQDRFNSALSSIQNMLFDYPDDPSIKYLQAICLYNLERYLEAERILKPLILDHPQNEKYFYLLASVYIDQGQYDKALNPCKKLVELKPEETNYFLRLANCYFNINELKKACRVLENKLEKGNSTVYDFPLYSELYFLTAHMEDEWYHSKVIERIERLPKNQDEKSKLLNMMVDLVASLESNHFMFKELVLIIGKINNGYFDDVSEWLELAEKEIDPTLIYYGDHNPKERVEREAPSPVPQNSQAATYEHSPVAETVTERGSILWSFVLGIIVSIIFTPIVGIIVGFVYYFNSKKIKEIIGCLGCLVVIIIIAAIILGL